MKKYRVAVIGDSFAMQRMYLARDNSINDIVLSKGVIEIKAEETYPELLKSLLDDKFTDIAFTISNLSASANTSYNAYNYKTVELYMEQTDFVILGIGLVDCWNRKGISWGPFPHMEGKNPWVSKEEYERDMSALINFINNMCKTVKYIFVLNIPLITEDQYIKHPDSFERSVEYSKILYEIVERNKNIVLIDIFSCFKKIEKKEFETLFCHDNVHYNGNGNKIVAELIFEKFESIINYFEAEKLYHENQIDKALKNINQIDKNQLTEDYQKKVERLERICLKKVKDKVNT